MEFILFLVAIGASTIGAISGIGGGVIIKPVMDAVSGLDAATISFMSGCTVLCMAVSTYIRGLKSEIKLNYSISIPLAIGGAVGGVVGKQIFSAMQGNTALVQAALLLFVNVGVLLYVVCKKRINTLQVTNKIASIAIGFMLGCVSSFLGIGGGPINIAVLYYFYSMTPKITAKNSLFIILLSQITSFLTTVVTRTVPQFDVFAIVLMCAGGVGGALIGAKFSKMLSEDYVERLFVVVLIGLILLGSYNVYTFAV